MVRSLRSIGRIRRAEAPDPSILICRQPRPLLEWLHYNGSAVVTKPAKESTDATGRRRIKGSIGVELAVDAIEMAPHYDHLVLFSGDGDFTALVAFQQRSGKRVTVVSTLATARPMIADDLRRQADFFLDLADLAKTAGRPATVRNTESPPTPRGCLSAQLFAS